ncbi:hypothetical protein KGF57_001776 [Candida theae]|uniref:NTF2 domain-containing protein n=1 Tax=Candida theae TaxID=1198502 RepID=A0AAD5FZH9_9ASCO|nr:uncharacterized protein KGF57_001776 [Candida theae]KAI5961353.1 hypothetical protein KGF57_001776 [Candida theae]
MTTSPTPAQEERKQTPSTAPAPAPAANGEQALSDERVSNIGWYFIKSYYDFYIAKLDVIHKIYHDNASILHDAFPKDDKKNGGEGELTASYKAKGTDAIKKCFAEHLSGGGNDNNRIVITSATFQVSLEKNIIIVTFGEWSKNDSPFKQFTQTFVLTPGKRESTYDLANDILKFVENNGYKQQAKKEEQEDGERDGVDAGVKSAVEEPTPESIEKKVVDKKEEKEQQAPVEVKNEEVSGPEKEETVVEKAEPKKVETPEPPAKEDENEQQQQPQEQQPQQESPKKEKKPEETAKPKSPPQPMTWADLAYQAVPASKPASKPTTSTSTATSTPTSTKKTPVATPPQQSSSGASGAGSGKFKKDEWYPIYIRGIRSIDEKVLRDHITKKFGELKFFRTSQNIALCDFVLKEAQRKALDAKETTLDGVVINLEPRESKTGNNFHNNGGHKKKFGDKEGGKDKVKGVSGNANAAVGGSGKFTDGRKISGTGGNTKQKAGKLTK